MNKKIPMRIVHVCPFYYPATSFGGPIFSTKSICDGIAARNGFEVKVLTTDSAGPRLDQKLDVGSDPVRFKEGYDVTYTRRKFRRNNIAPGLLLRLPGIVRWADVVHLTLVYSYLTIPTLALARAFGKPVVWSPRGSLQATEEWSEVPHKGSKKTFERLANMVRPRRTVLHVTAVVERNLSVKRLSGIETVLIPNSVDIPSDVPDRDWRRDGKLHLVFLSRLHPKKGLEFLLDAMERLPDHVLLDVYGSGDPEYVSGLAARIATLRAGSRILLHGHVDGAAKARAYRAADLFVLPTNSENFGIAIAESLAHGVPVITTKGAPWAALEQWNCGLHIDQSVEALTSAILTLDSADLEQMGARGRAWMQRDYSPVAMTDRFEELYRKLIVPDNAGDQARV